MKLDERESEIVIIEDESSAGVIEFVAEENADLNAFIEAEKDDSNDEYDIEVSEDDSDYDNEVDDESDDSEVEDDEEAIDGDDDDEDEEDEYDDDEEYDFEEDEDEETYRRRMRRQRKVRNQIISYSVVTIIVLLLGTGIFFGTRALLGVISDKKSAKQAEAEAAEQAAAEAEAAEEPIVELPESLEPELESETDEEEIIEDIDYLGEAVSATISQMTLEDKVAQLFIITPEALTGVDAATQAGDGTREALTNYAVGGLLYSKKNIVDSDQLTELINNTKGMSKYELFFGITEPGGEESVLANSPINDIPAVDGPEAIGETGESSNAYNAGVTISSYLSSYGFNLNMAPNGTIIVDENSIAKKNSYGSDEAAVYDMTAQMIQGLAAGNVNACLTGFPGYSDITSASADGETTSEITIDQLMEQILPYIAGTAAGANFVQLNNVIYVNADGGAKPASVSPYIIGSVLRNNMSFEGVIITAPLNEKAITDVYSSDEAVVAAIEAGADMICMPEDFATAYEGLLEAVKTGKISESRIDESLERIFRIKLEDDLQ